MIYKIPPSGSPLWYLYMMERINILITKFWEGNISLKEVRELQDILEHRGEDWKSFLKTAYNSDLSKEKCIGLSPARAEEILQLIYRKAEIRQPAVPFVKNRIVQLLAAAIAIILFSWLGLLYNHKPETGKLQSKNFVELSDTVHLMNKRSAPSFVLLPDGSKVKLAQGSSLYYIAGTYDHERKVKLEGEARFSVVSNKHRPFTVVANGYSTVALGTEFVISTSPVRHTRVKLLSGRVVVRSEKEATHPLQDVYLKPGDELSIDRKDGSIVLKNNLKPKVIFKHLVQETKKEPYPDLSAELVFNRTVLTEVFQLVERRFGKRILFEHAKLDQLTFTGKFKPNDSLEVILDVVCGVNDLSFTEQDGVISIVNN